MTLERESRMSNVDFDLLRKYTSIPQPAERILSHPERETSFDITVYSVAGMIDHVEVLTEGRP